MKMNTSAWDDVEAMGGGMPRTQKKKSNMKNGRTKTKEGRHRRRMVLARVEKSNSRPFSYTVIG